jgi:hypothetical protein
MLKMGIEPKVTTIPKTTQKASLNSFMYKNDLWEGYTWLN